MCNLEKPTIKTLGWIFTLVFLLGACILIILAGIHFNFASQSFTSSPWGALGGVELASVIYLFVVAAVGLCGFLFEGTLLMIIFVVLLGLAVIFLFAISVFALVGGSIKWFNTSIGCDTKYNGLLDTYAAIDSYLIQADSAFCTKDCPCYMNSTTTASYIANDTTVPFYNQWTKTNVASQAFNFTMCPPTVQNSVYNNYISTNAYFNYTFEPTSFAKYWGHIESWFNCTGFCTTSYFNENTQTNNVFYKYLFTDINRGVPQQIGCLTPILNWLPPTLNAFGSIGLFTTGFMSFVLYLGIVFLCNNKEGSANEKPPKSREVEMSKKDQI